ncbi:zonadhesin-like isoform X7 [Pectinophora gossypiella]|uniref:zonadhesin-like isoform X3 n=1 Tax=Pectinophora gossypiella TaxID=13191 RepID=UPI00214F5EE1|nr:zonadhesin-like isoform X3 [Pectinophora gossypiella]XP_049870933.1 zonadhesin-like isoform X4 [Pectinophora gossypiella]XP_049870934.1 zonadhesin-like isoform X5 [Pectinophora gossypiella]XP_049870935.1 zonadhesin-like isoform X6 [Pectinophora gossypiella]XP_049870936.1 zonadhesin-like isoform X7 [Pectinophora gossypiella]
MWIALLLISSVWATNTPTKTKCRFPSGVYKPPKAPPNEYYELCPKLCPTENCSALWMKRKCPPEPKCCPPPAFRCKEGLYRNDEGKCVTSYECTGQTPPCGYNEEWVTEKTCPPKFCNISYTEYKCIKNVPKESGCDCIKDHLRNSSGICVPSNECDKPKRCGANETLVDYISCPPLACNISYTSYICDQPRRPCKPPVCDCKKDYLRTDDGICVLNNDCPPPKPPCGENQTTVDCTFKCPYHYCPHSDDRTEYACKPPRDCPSGCGCKIGYRYKSNDDETCILAEDCPPVECTRANEVWDPCPEGCWTDSCDDADKKKGTCNELVHNCQPKCVCQKGYYRNAAGVCVKKSQCYEPVCGKNETKVDCTFKCPHHFCPKNDELVEYACKPPRDCPSGCGCALGYRYKSSKDLTCILAEDCPPVNCTRPHEVWSRCPVGCWTDSCEDADKQGGTCNELVHNCQPKCVCEKGYYRNKSGVCVKKSKCYEPVCGKNETKVDCTFKCPHHFCPKNDNQVEIACKPPRDCPSGCGCAVGYRYKSSKDQTCILAEDCPPVNCTRPHEVWSRCPVGCWTDSCEDADKQGGTCNELVHNCQPKCVCEKGYYRNKSGVCVKKSKCYEPVCGKNETKVDCTFKCPHHFCPKNDNQVEIACKPPRDCPSGCGCAVGYRYKSSKDQTCILAEDCPPVKCTRPNEVWNSCSSSCLAESCQDLERPESVCNEFVKSCIPRCVCQKGYYRNESDICVPKCDCKKCPPNQRYVGCKVQCPYDYCPIDDNRAVVACDPPPPEYCRGGCICNLNYKRKSYNNDTCILARKCPPVKCTRPNEEWSPCPSPCLDKSCEDARRPATNCNYLVKNCQPRCVCQKKYYRNNDDECVPLHKCPCKTEIPSEKIIPPPPERADD